MRQSESLGTPALKEMMEEEEPFRENKDGRSKTPEGTPEGRGDQSSSVECARGWDQSNSEVLGACSMWAVRWQLGAILIEC